MPILVHLWDYGWLCHDRVQLPRAPSDSALLQNYVSSVAFNTSFLPNDKDETGIHGPFIAGRITAKDFVPLHDAGLEQYLETVQLSESTSDDAAERIKMAQCLRAAFREGQSCYVLRHDETNRELLHEWGSVLFIFREFLFVGPERDNVERFVIGYD